MLTALLLQSIRLMKQEPVSTFWKPKIKNRMGPINWHRSCSRGFKSGKTWQNSAVFEHVAGDFLLSTVSLTARHALVLLTSDCLTFVVGV